MLIKTIRMETNDDQLFSKSAPLLAAASELAYHTVNCSVNAEELRRENGIQVLQDEFSRCVNVLSLSSKPEELSVQVCTHIVRCYSVAAQFKGCREKIQECPAIIKDLCRILYYKNVPKLCSVIAECVCAFCVDFWLQTHLFQSGVLWHLLLYLFQYDYTLEEGGVEKSGESNQQEVSNQLARLCIFACARLGGYYIGESENSTPDNPAVKKSLSAMLTPYLARKLAHENPSDLLKVLNSNTENPYLIWDNATRMQLGEFLGDQQLQMIRTGECDPDFGGMFVFDVHAKELIVGEIFVRAYNEQPTFPLENAKGFTIDLLDFLGSQAQYLHSLLMLQQSKQQSPDGQGSTQLSRLGQVEMAIEALRNVIRNNPGVEIQCIGHFKLLFCLLRLDDCAKLQQYALEVINLVSANHECVKDIAASEVQAYLLLAIQLLQGCRVLTLETLAALMSSTKVVKEAITKGATVYLLDLFCNATNPAVREKTAELFAKMLADKLVGPRVRIILGKFLPGIFMDAIRDSAEEVVSLHLYSLNGKHVKTLRIPHALGHMIIKGDNLLTGDVQGNLTVYEIFGSKAKEDLLSKPIHNYCLSRDHCLSLESSVLSIDMKTVQVSELEHSTAHFTFVINKGTSMHGFCTWFEAEFCPLATGGESVSLNTGPDYEITHWQQNLFLLDDPITVSNGDKVKGRIEISRNPEWRRHLLVLIKFTVLSGLQLDTEIVEGEKLFHVWR